MRKFARVKGESHSFVKTTKTALCGVEKAKKTKLYVKAQTKKCPKCEQLWSSAAVDMEVEVGDVWMHKGIEYIVIEIDETTIYCKKKS